MGYRDALIGGLLATAGLRGRNTRGWFLASGGADAADLLGGLSVHRELKRGQRLIGLGGAVVGIGGGFVGGRPPAEVARLGTGGSAHKRRMRGLDRPAAHPSVTGSARWTPAA